jgi:hypothetical protein
MLIVVIVWLIAVMLLMAGYTLVWLLCPQLRAWMEAPRARLLEQERRFSRVGHQRRPQADSASLGPGLLRVPSPAPGKVPSPSRRIRAGAGPVRDPAA